MLTLQLFIHEDTTKIYALNLRKKTLKNLNKKFENTIFILFLFYMKYDLYIFLNFLSI